MLMLLLACATTPEDTAVPASNEPPPVRMGFSETYDGSSPGSVDEVFFEAVLFEERMSVHEFGTIVTEAQGGTVRFGLYEGFGDRPSHLLVATAESETEVGEVIVPARSVIEVDAGTYWLAASFGVVPTWISASVADSPPNIHWEARFPFDEPLPASLSSSDLTEKPAGIYSLFVLTYPANE